ncbi:BTB/POZ domain-containing protein At3g05675 [Selaginella moellendorffii]|nr:BTB/POZ domain-containing protein At3g05675 [Selaginella moellendorffii]|eukprot:XP_002960731.2 BTB/POZ domain-containing protein At3g05675 [Selaginella moellendorffii]
MAKARDKRIFLFVSKQKIRVEWIMAKRDEIASAMARKRQRVSSSGSDSSRVGQITGNGFPANREDCAGDEQQHQEQLQEQGSRDVKVDPDKARIISFGEESTADVVVHLIGDEEENVLHLHSQVLAKSRYFAALLSERWKGDDQASMAAEQEPPKTHLRINTTSPMPVYLGILRLFYTENFSEAIVDVQSALALLPVTAELLYDDCMARCLKFLEAVPWSREEEQQILQLLNYLQLEETPEIIARVIPGSDSAVETMLSELVYAATHNHQNAASVKLFVGKILDSHKSRETVRLVLDNAFKNGLKTVKDSVEEYSSPNVRGRHDEIEAMQRQNLHTAVVSGRHLLWLVERMIELKVAENAVLEWSEQSSFTANLKRAFMDDVWRNNVPGLPAVLLRCTSRLAQAMVTGSILVSREVRKKMVRDWLPVLITSKENAVSANCNKQLHQNLEEVFLKLISTLPVGDAQELLQQCLSFASRGLDESSNLAMAFATWFRRAGASENS